MKKKTIEKNMKYDNLVYKLSELLLKSKKQVYSQVNNILVETYWKTGKYIVEYEQKGQIKAEYGKRLIENLSRDLSLKFGKGFSISNLKYMRKFYMEFPIGVTVSHLLTWSHYFQLLKIENKDERGFYINEIINQKWTLRELRRQINSCLYERLVLSKKNPKDIKKLAKRGQEIKVEEDIVKNYYFLDFLGIDSKIEFQEKDIETSIINNIEKFLLELGKGFCFYKRQYRLNVNNKHYHIDLVFYNFILKSFVLIDLKLGEIKHTDIGQMNFYINYFEKEEKNIGDNKTIGILLSSKKDDLEVEYALGGISNKIFLSKYSMILPKKEELKQKVLEVIELHKK
jgi:predicted nuclease of restriction endonuclease-like (RecB) superfamily